MFDELPEPCEAEEDMLDLAFGLTPTYVHPIRRKKKKHQSRVRTRLDVVFSHRVALHFNRDRMMQIQIRMPSYRRTETRRRSGTCGYDVLFPRRIRSASVFRYVYIFSRSYAPLSVASHSFFVLQIELPSATRNFYVDGHVPQPH